MENNKEMPKGKVKVIRRLDNGEEVEWECFWDNGWWDANSGVRIPNVIKWIQESKLNEDGKCNSPQRRLG